MEFRYLKDYDHQSTLDILTKEWLLREERKLNKTTALVALYCTYLKCADPLCTNFSLREMIQSEAFEAHLRCFIGFIYIELNCANINKYNYSKEVIDVFNKYARQLKVKNKSIALSARAISDDVNNCITYYNLHKKSKIKIKYFSGWKIFSSENKKINMNISFIYDKYGEELTTRLWQALIKIGERTISTTLSKKVGYTLILFRLLAESYENLQELNVAMSSENVTDSMLYIYNLGLIDAKLKKYNIGHYHTRWSSVVDIYYELVNYNIFDEPITEILRPRYKQNTCKNTSTNLRKNKYDNIEHCKLLTPISVSLTDDEAKEQLFKRIINEVEHVSYCSKKLIEQSISRFNYFIETALSGKIRTYNRVSKTSNRIKVGYGFESNIFCTYLDKPFFHDQVSNYRNFLGISGLNEENIKINKKLYFCSYNVLYPFLLELIKEHPAITESWLLNWEYTNNNKKSGFFEIDGNFYIKSYKKRRGYKDAEQTIKLSEYSKKIVENIIQLTSICRKYLKEKKHLDSEYMLLISRTPFSEPTRVKKIENGTCTTLIYSLKSAYEINSYKDNKILVSEENSRDIFKNLTLTKYRASCGVIVYFETKSIHKMSVALGHKNYDPQLIDSYLPDTLWKYFTNRWIRIFQNALLYEALKHSNFLFETVDFTSKQLKDFIKNHAFDDIPQHISLGYHQSRIENKKNQNKENYIGIFPITVPLLQIFITLNVIMTEIEKHRKIIKEKYMWWFTSAKYVLDTIEMSNNNLAQINYLTKDIYKMYDIAKTNPIKVEILLKAMKDD